MIQPRDSDGRLVDAFQSIDVPDEDVPEDVRERIWLAVSGALPAEERRDIVELTASHPAYAEAWRVAQEMWQAAQAAETATRPADARSPGARWTPRWLAAAAVVLLGTALGVTTLLNRPPVEEFRAPGSYRVESLVPGDSALPRDAFRLRWAPGPAGSRYTVRVTTEDLQVLTTATDLEVTELTVAPALLAPVGGGATVLWQVEATLPTGERVTSDTFAMRVR